MNGAGCAGKVFVVDGTGEDVCNGFLAGVRVYKELYAVLVYHSLFPEILYFVPSFFNILILSLSVKPNIIDDDEEEEEEKEEEGGKKSYDLENQLQELPSHDPS